MSERNADNEEGNARGAISRGFSAVNRAVEIFEVVIIAGGILVMAALMTANVLGRLVFHHGIPGTTEMTEMLILIVTFVGVAYATRHARHISMSAVYDQLSGTPRKVLLILICLGTGAMMFYLAWLSLGYTIGLYELGRVSSTVQIPIWIVTASLPLGFTLAGIQYLLTIVRNLTSDEIYRSFTDKDEYAEVPDDEIGSGSSVQDSGL